MRNIFQDMRFLHTGQARWPIDENKATQRATCTRQWTKMDGAGSSDQITTGAVVKLNHTQVESGLNSTECPVRVRRLRVALFLRSAHSFQHLPKSSS